MITFKDIPGTIKAAIAIGALAVGGFTYHDKFITEAEAAESERIAWIRDLEAEIRTLKRQYRQEGNAALKASLLEEVAELEEKVRCVRQADEDKVKFC